jgi:type II secretory pathway pseudopilin PulG
MPIKRNPKMISTAFKEPSDMKFNGILSSLLILAFSSSCHGSIGMFANVASKALAQKAKQGNNPLLAAGMAASQQAASQQAAQQQAAQQQAAQQQAAQQAAQQQAAQQQAAQQQQASPYSVPPAQQQGSPYGVPPIQPQAAPYSVPPVQQQQVAPYSVPPVQPQSYATSPPFNVPQPNSFGQLPYQRP